MHVEYADVREGHEVANEVCVDLWSSVMRGSRQQRIKRAGRAQHHLRQRRDCRRGRHRRTARTFHSDAVADLLEPTPDALRLHRVLTDDARIVAKGSTFRYSVTPGAVAEAHAQ